MLQVSALPGGHAGLEAGVRVVINLDSYSDAVIKITVIFVGYDAPRILVT